MASTTEGQRLDIARRYRPLYATYVHAGLITQQEDVPMAGLRFITCICLNEATVFLTRIPTFYALILVIEIIEHDIVRA